MEHVEIVARRRQSADHDVADDAIEAVALVGDAVRGHSGERACRYDGGRTEKVAARQGHGVSVWGNLKVEKLKVDG